MLVQSFSAYGFELTLVPDGETALASSQDIKPDLIFLDVTLPGLSGFDTCLRLKEQDETKNIPVIFVTISFGYRQFREGIFGGSGRLCD